MLGAGELRAQELGPILLSYRAAEGCPEVADFQRSVQRRSTDIHFVDEGTHERELSIVIGKAGDFTSGELRLVERDGSVRQRSVRFTSCAEAVEGLALIAAVSLDPRALSEPASASDAPAKPAVTEPSKPSKPSKSSESSKPATPARADPAVPASLELGLGGELRASYRQLPATALGGTLFVDVGSSSRSWFSPLFQGALGYSQLRGYAANNAEASFTLTLATLSACPIRLGVGFLTLRPCAFASGGVLHAWGSETTDPRARTRPHFSWGGSTVLFAQVTRSLEIVGDVGVGVSLLRDRFVLDQVEFWRTPALCLSSGVGLRFVLR